MLKVSSLFGSGAVLCRRKEIRVFGEADEGVPVRCVLTDADGRTMAIGETECVNGRFTVRLPAQEAAEGCTLTVTAGPDIFIAPDVAVGDVYLAGGQSNMELELQNADGGQELIRTHVNPRVRYFNVPKRAYACAEEQRAFENTRWKDIRPGEARDMSAAAYFFATALQPQTGVTVGIIDCYWGGTSITAWMDREWLERTAEGKRYLDAYAEKAGDKTLEQYLTEEKAFQDAMDRWNRAVSEFRASHPGATGQEVNEAAGPCPWFPPAGPGSPYRPGALYPLMIAKAAPAALTGILFYQGEEDADKTEHYDILLTQMADRWRTAFEDDTIPFLNVQLPMWIAAGAPDSFQWPRIRLAQAKVRDTLRNSGLICLLDQGEYDNIHPTNKRVVGERLCELAKAMVYGMKGEVSPRALSCAVSGDTMTVRLSAPVRSRDGEEPRLLELAGPDGVFHPARAEANGTDLRLRSEGVPHPARARYAWTDYGIVNLFGENGLPL